MCRDQMHVTILCLLHMPLPAHRVPHAALQKTEKQKNNSPHVATDTDVTMDFLSSFSLSFFLPCSPRRMSVTISSKSFCSKMKTPYLFVEQMLSTPPVGPTR